MKKSVSIKLLIFSLLLVTANITYSDPSITSGSGIGSIKAGIDNRASGHSSSAFGYQNEASGDSTSAFGFQNKASGEYSSAFGWGNTASGKESSAFGYWSIASGKESSAFGHRNEASGSSSSAFGVYNKATGNLSSAFGYFNKASGKYSSVLGSLYQVTGEKSGAFGVGEYGGTYNFVNEGSNSYMIGNYNKIGNGSDGNFILGNNVSIGAGTQNSVVLGNNSVSGGSNTVSVGSSSNKRKIVNVADGEVSATSTDAITGKQLYGIAKASSSDIDVVAWKNKLGVSSASGITNTGTGMGSTGLAGSNNNIVSAPFATAVGNKNNITGAYAGAFGGLNEVSGEMSYVVGVANTIKGDNNFVLGRNVTIEAGIQNSVVLGKDSDSGGSNTVSVGSSVRKRKIVNVGDATISATSSEAVTGKQLYSGDGIDTNAWKTKLGVGSGGVDLTSYTKRDASNLTASDVTTWQTKLDVTKKDDYKDANDIDVNKWKTKLGVGSSGVDLTSYTKRDASNLTASDITAWKAKLGVGSGGGGGIANSATGTGSTGLGVDNTVSGDYSTAVGYKNKVTGNHSGAFGDLNVVTGSGSYAFGNDNTINGDNNFVLGNNVTIAAGIQNSVALGNNSTVSSSNEVSVGSKGKERKITNVADGDISATSTDAVNGGQLYKVMQNSGAAGIENLRNEVYEKIDDVKDEVRGVGSLSAALAGLHPMQYDPKAPAQVMAALGQYKNKQSVAVGLSYYFNDRFMMSAGLAIAGERRPKTMANVGFTLKLGKGSGVAYNETPQYVVQNEVKRLTVENNKQAKENQELKAEVNSLTIKTKEQDEKIKNLEEKLNMLLKTK